MINNFLHFQVLDIQVNQYKLQNQGRVSEKSRLDQFFKRAFEKNEKI